MANILVLTELSNGQIKKGSLELLSAARKSGLKIQALMLGTGSQAAVEQLGKEGVDEVILNESDLFNQYNPELFTEVIAQVLQSKTPRLVLASSNSLNRDLMPRVACRIGAGVTSDCTELQISSDGSATVRRPMYAGKCSAEVAFENCSVQIVLMRPNQLPIETSSSVKSPTVEEIAPPQSSLKTLIKEVVKGATGKLDLTEANVIVAGGRGMKEASQFKLLEDLADVLGATVGASRAVVDAGWVPHSMQVGQTGKTVAPSLYIACGISGAIQHLAGMSGSKVIVAINKDANAPIFQKATYGIVGDVFEVLPVLTEEFKKLIQH